MDYAQKRSAFGQPIASLQGIQVITGILRKTDHFDSHTKTRVSIDVVIIFK